MNIFQCQVATKGRSDGGVGVPGGSERAQRWEGPRLRAAAEGGLKPPLSQGRGVTRAATLMNRSSFSESEQRVITY